MCVVVLYFDAMLPRASRDDEIARRHSQTVRSTATRQLHRLRPNRFVRRQQNHISFQSLHHLSLGQAAHAVPQLDANHVAPRSRSRAKQFLHATPFLFVTIVA